MKLELAEVEAIPRWRLGKQMRTPRKHGNCDCSVSVFAMFATYQQKENVQGGGALCIRFGQPFMARSGKKKTLNIEHVHPKQQSESQSKEQSEKKKRVDVN